MNKSEGLNGNLVLTRQVLMHQPENKNMVRITIPLAKLKKMVQDGRDAQMDIKTYGLEKNSEGVHEVRLAFMDRSHDFHIERSERLSL